MTTRRDFLTTSSASLAALAVTGCAKTDTDTQGGAATASDDLPPAIAALTPMKDGVVPISVDERKARLEKARRLMTEQKIDALMLAGGTSLEYFTGMKWGNSERLLAVVIPAKGAPFLVTPKFEEERALEQAHMGPLGKEATVYAWEEHENPYAFFAKGLKDRGLSAATIGVEETVRFQFSDGAAHIPQVRTTSGTPITAGCRIVKDAHELALMRHASAVTLKAYEAAYRSLKEGMTQDDFAELVQLAHRRLGYSGSAGVQVGKFSALPHGSATPQTVQEGSILLIDGGCKVEGYSSDISRTFVLGKATQRMKDVFEIEFKAQSAALAAAKPGVPCEAVDAAARKVIVDAGFGPDYKFFSHRVGHGMGMDGHEWPYLVRGNTLPLAPGMVFSDEPGIYIPGEFGIRLEDDMVITETGAELFTPQSESLEKPF
ncbi:Xaa-Pro peptidase family protein [Gemmatimonas sp.]|uniref:M24 family metallopeptidase n=1 Tax=Gemmatimonas sp. TaxID=1962908 RepID=UPI0027B87DE4|nr:Xaa-Pro peptidase family protein [Gemmatimonas sp.]